MLAVFDHPSALIQILTLIGIPLLIVAAIALMVLMPGWTRAGRWRPGQPWEHDPVLINAELARDVTQALADVPEADVTAPGHPQLPVTADVTAVVPAVSGIVEVAQGGEGGASARW